MGPNGGHWDSVSVIGEYWGSAQIIAAQWVSLWLIWAQWGSLVLGRDQWRSVGGHWESLGLSGSQLVLLKFSGDQQSPLLGLRRRSLGFNECHWR